MEIYFKPLRRPIVDREIEVNENNINLMIGSKSLFQTILSDAFPNPACAKIFNQKIESDNITNETRMMQIYYDIAKDEFYQKVSKNLPFIWHQKFTDVLPESKNVYRFNIDLGADATLPLVNQYFALLTERFNTNSRFPIESYYKTKEDLVYASYRANEMARFLATYDITYYTKVSNFEAISAGNPYDTIFSMFAESDIRIDVKDMFVKSLLDFTTVTSQYSTMPNTYKHIVNDFKEPYSFIYKSWNETVEIRTEYINSTIRNNIFNWFLKRCVEPVVVNDMNEGYAHGKPYSLYQTSEDAINAINAQFENLMFNLLNPLALHADTDLALVSRVVNLNVEDMDQGLRDFNNTLRAFLTTPMFNTDFPKLAAIKPDFIDVQLRADDATPNEFTTYALKSKDKPIEIDGRLFENMISFVTYRSMIDLLSYNENYAYTYRHANLENEFKLELLTKNLESSTVRNVSRLFLDKSILEKYRGTFILYRVNDDSQFFKAFFNFLSYYITNSLSRVEDEITNPIILNWIQKRVGTLMNIFDISNKMNSFVSAKSLFNLWEILLGLPRNTNSNVIFSLPDEARSNEVLHDAYTYIKQELSFIKATLTTDDEIIKCIQDGSNSIVSMYGSFSDEQIVTVLKTIYDKIYPYLTTGIYKEFDIATDARIFVALVKLVTLDNTQEITNISQIRSNKQFLVNFILMYHIHCTK